MVRWRPTDEDPLAVGQKGTQIAAAVAVQMQVQREAVVSEGMPNRKFSFTIVLSFDEH